MHRRCRERPLHDLLHAIARFDGGGFSPLGPPGIISFLFFPQPNTQLLFDL
jgi:hypothetical protein